jgi:drug/metabolite transporter (DMT)-like permease
MEKSKRVWVYMFYTILVVTWGSSFILMKRSLEYYTAPQVATLRQLSALVTLIGFAVFHLRHIPPQKLGYLALSGLLGMFIPAYLFCYAELGVGSAIAGILNALTPAFTLVVGAVFFNQRILRMHIIGILVGFIGIALLIFVNPAGKLVINHFAFFVIVATICYGFNINLVKMRLGELNPLHLTTVSVSIAGICSLVYLLITGGFHVLPVTPQNKIPLLAAIALGVLGTAVAQLLFNQVIKRSSALFASSIVYALPVIAVFWGILDGEQFLIWHFSGMACILIGIVIIRRAR